MFILGTSREQMVNKTKQIHRLSDTYKIIRDGLTEFSLERFFEDGRVFTAIIDFDDSTAPAIMDHILLSFAKGNKDV